MRQPLTIVTGGSRGIGAAICARLAAEGHDVVVGYRSGTEAAHDVAKAVRAAGRRSLAVQVDTADGGRRRRPRGPPPPPNRLAARETAPPAPPRPPPP
ncbi:SDR family NAD(P)-dependent oxidoreductase, partial [Streptomyces sp. NPDC054802]